MVYVRLVRDWTDDEGESHTAGDLVDVDAATLARLQAEGVVGEGAGAQPDDSQGWGGAPTRPRFPSKGRPPGPDYDDDEW